ncbi:GPI ethanolamine phosphate transferase, stabilizing subunit-like isoform X1 [Tubulanus polymorphus]|uniref:GPI ethanolamine phosphate transferase, stabilizing subunit-like isoform X1 n=1 Tax=Tubulanus polymorphus TaxID=672921 RepID=UPI003DA5B063
MSAPRGNKTLGYYSLSKQGISILLWFNLTQIVWLSVLFAVANSTVELFHIVKHPLAAIKVFMLVIGLLNIVSTLQVAPTIESFRKKSIEVQNVLKCGLITFMGTIIYHAIAILFGAPVFEQMEETYYFSILLSATTVLPSCCVLGASLSEWRRLYLELKPENFLETNILITTFSSLLGAWIGAFPIPLDWDRPWQTWPITCVAGTVIGYLAGLLIATVRIGWKQTGKRKSV